MRDKVQEVIAKLDGDLEDIPEYGELMALQEFVEECVSGFFIDYDGSGYYATETQMTRIRVKPSDVTHGKIENWSHVVWFNR